ncbi:GntR family transcriptional regulator [Ammoniphilus resinae]|uniref:DNA-binding GntR family transcriptional regulator n=1 Tax=Ammoniphilus resinae TaxID=861532 RepID=A0ABS4GUC2_9BACL|nr:GntR family transcriptional regulator [Ammoniphilus resinae]MBP1933873.1 DNA-binding GntR family transcriptional regulator [Ammoniphilus resinae]
MAIKRIEPGEIKSLRDIVLESLRDAIISGELKPGEHLKERDLAGQMGISTTPIKEALRILGHEGLVETVPRRGTFVSTMVDSSVEELLMLKASLEGLSARLAAMKMSEEEMEDLRRQIQLMEKLSCAKEEKREQLTEENENFHVMIRAGAKNSIITQMIMNVVAYDQAIRKRALQFNVEVEEGFSEHRQIYEAIQERNAELAEQRMKNHIMRTAENVLKNLKNR